MTPDQLQFVADNQPHFDLVINQAQHFDRSHDIASKVLIIGQELTGQPIDHCTDCVKSAYILIQKQYDEQNEG